MSFEENAVRLSAAQGWKQHIAELKVEELWIERKLG